MHTAMFTALMAEVADSIGEEGDAVLIAAVHRVLVAHGAAGVHNGGDTRLARLLHAVAPRKGEERVGGHHRALNLLPRLLQSDLHTLHAVRLPTAHAQHPVVLGDGDGVGLDVLDAGPGELDILHLLLRGLLLADAREGDVRRLERVHVLVQPPAAHLAQLPSARVAWLGLKNAQRLRLALESGKPLLCVSGCDHDLVEHSGVVVCRGAELADLLRQLHRQGAVERHNASKGTDGIGADCKAVGLKQILGGVGGGRGDAARVGVLHNHTRGRVKVAHRGKGGLGVEVVVVAHLLAVVQDGGGNPRLTRLCQALVCVHRCCLVGVLTVPAHAAEGHGDRHLRGKLALAHAPSVPEPLRHLAVVGCGVLVSLPGKALAQLGHVSIGHLAPQHLQDEGVVQGVHHHQHILVVLCRRPQHGGPADVDLLDAVLEGGAAVDGLLEGVEVAHHDVDGPDLVLLQRGHVLGVPPLGQDAAVHHRVQRLHAPVQHLREPGDLIHLGDGDAGRGDGLGAATRGHHLVPELREALCQLREAGLVEHGHQSLSLGRTREGLHTHRPGHGERRESQLAKCACVAEDLRLR
mmetsp:Transcript_1941/g.3328  ORF Transcript_1941/g.3328 Transcript_1941/m.3328 type:complete len:578 (-) Transcript_1941:183-1916(-)